VPVSTSINKACYVKAESSRISFGLKWEDNQKNYRKKLRIVRKALITSGKIILPFLPLLRTARGMRLASDCAEAFAAQANTFLGFITRSVWNL